MLGEEVAGEVIDLLERTEALISTLRAVMLTELSSLFQC